MIMELVPEGELESESDVIMLDRGHPNNIKDDDFYRNALVFLLKFVSPIGLKVISFYY